MYFITFLLLEYVLLAQFPKYAILSQAMSRKSWQRVLVVLGFPTGRLET